MNWGNSLEIEIGGAVRTFKFTMVQSAILADIFKDNPSWIENPDKKDLVMLMTCLKNKKNTLPDNFDEEDLADWLAEMNEVDRNKLFEFSNEAMGFLISQLTLRMEQLVTQTEKMTAEIQAFGQS